jgi:hypothetical protein
MIRTLLFILLIAAPFAFADVRLDPQQIRQWNRQLDNEYPQDKPVIAHFKNGEYELFYLAAQHETNLKTPTLRLVEKLYQHDFKALIVEAFQRSEGQSPSWALRDAINGLKKDFIKGGEPALSIIRANSRKIPFFGGEPDHHELYSALKARGYSDLDVVGFYVIRQIPQWIRENQNKSQLLERNVPGFVKMFCPKFPISPCPSLYEIRSWYKLRMDKELTADISSDEISPAADGKLFTQKISTAVGDVRDRFTLRLIEEMLNRYHQVAIVYGSGHFTTLKKSFEAALGKPTYEED